METNSQKIAVIGLGYVGLPLAVEFAKKFLVVGFDINQTRVDELNSGHDATLEIEDDNLNSVLVTLSEVEGSSSPLEKPARHVDSDGGDSRGIGLILTTSPDRIADCNIYIVTVPTPTDKNNRPVLTPLIKASETIGKVLKQNDIVIYESTVYPGATEEDCVPVLEKFSGMTFNKDFFVGYSPERINPGDKLHTVTKIKKVTSGSTPETGKKVNELYKTIIVAGTHLAPSIKVAEAAKVIENSQRDIIVKKEIKMETKILEIINTVLENRSKSKITSLRLETHLRNDVGFDSLDLAELTVCIEAEYDVDIFEDGIVNTVDEILKKLNSK